MQEFPAWINEPAVAESQLGAMKLFAAFVLFAMMILGSSCRDGKEMHDSEFMARLAKLEADFCSTNISLAESSLLAHRQWLLELMAAGEMNNHNLFQTDSRLFQIYEFKGETNKSETFYKEAVEAYDKYLRTQHRLEDHISKEELRARLTHQQEGQNVGWKFQVKGKPAPNEAAAGNNSRHAAVDRP